MTTGTRWWDTDPTPPATDDELVTVRDIAAERGTSQDTVRYILRWTDPQVPTSRVTFPPTPAKYTRAAVDAAYADHGTRQAVRGRWGREEGA